MKIILRDSESGLYYQGAFRWTSELPQALNLLRVEAAVRLASNLRLKSAEVVSTYGAGHEEVLQRLPNLERESGSGFVMIGSACR